VLKIVKYASSLKQKINDLVTIEEIILGDEPFSVNGL